ERGGEKAAGIVYLTRIKRGGNAFELRALTRQPSGTFRPFRWREVESVALPGLTDPPAALKALDVNHDGQADLMIFPQYGSPQLLLGRRGEPPRPFSASLGPLSSASAAALSLMNLDGPALIVAQNTFARRVALDAKDHWEIQDQYNSGRNSAQILGGAALDTDGDGSKEIVLLD